MENYHGINRATYPDWLGWTILDEIELSPNETEEHRAEILVQLNYEVKDFYHDKKAA